MAGIPITLNFDLKAPLPLDSRLVIANVNQLNNINPKYSGMIVYAANTQKLYYLENLSTNTWSQLGTGSAIGGNLLNNVVYTTGDQSISGSKTFIATGFYYSGGFYRYDKHSRTVFEENVFINKINNQTSFGIYNHYFLNRSLPISGQLATLPVGIRTGNIVNLFFNQSGINNSNENNYIVEPTVMVRYTGNTFTSDIIPIIGHPYYNKRALKKINYNNINYGIYHYNIDGNYEDQYLKQQASIDGSVLGIKNEDIVNLYFGDVTANPRFGLKVNPGVLVDHGGNNSNRNLIKFPDNSIYSGKAIRKVRYNSTIGNGYENINLTNFSTLSNPAIIRPKTRRLETFYNINVPSGGGVRALKFNYPTSYPFVQGLSMNLKFNFEADNTPCIISGYYEPGPGNISTIFLLTGARYSFMQKERVILVDGNGGGFLHW